MTSFFSAKPFSLESKMIASFFSEQTFARGKEYLRQNRVIEIKSSPDFSHIKSKVHGSAQTIYQQDIHLHSIAGKLIFRDFCSCPVSGRCKHVAAVLLSLVDTRPVAVQRIDQWFEQLEQVAYPLEYPRGYGEPDDVLFVLSRDDIGVIVELRRGKLTKKGSYGKGSKVSMSDIEYGHTWAFSIADAKIVRLLLSIQSDRRYSKLYLKDDIGYLVLQKMLQTERCFWEENRVPLQTGEPKKLLFTWINASENQKQLQIALEGTDNWELIATEPPTYVEQDYLTIGLIDTEVPAAKLPLLTHIPPVASNDLERVSLKMVQHFSATSVPSPLKLDVIEVNTALQTKLSLTMVSLNGQDWLEPIANITFVYGEVSIPALPADSAIELVKHKRKTYQLHRDLDAEERAIDVIFSHGLFQIPQDVLPSSMTDQSVWSVGKLPDDIQSWVQFTSHGIAYCRDQGLIVEIADDFSLNVTDAELAIDIDEDDSGWFSLALTAEIDGEHVPLLPIIASWLSQFGDPAEDAELLLPGPNGRFIKVKAKTIRPLIKVITELFSGKGDSLKIPRNRAMLLNELSAQEISLLNGERMKLLAQKLANFSGVVTVEVPSGLLATLRPYQQQGLDWLCFLKDFGLGGILADDMGLGKTLQSIAFILKQQQLGANQRGTLIICPTSLVGNWAKEIAKFAPALKSVVIHGNRRKPLLETLAEYDVVITTYPLMVRDHPYYECHVFDHIVLDEAQQIKNAHAKVTQLIHGLKANFRLCLTGTPLENHLGELKSLMDFGVPGLLGQHQHFTKYFRQPIEKEGDADKAKELSQRISPFLLRRTKDQVVAELPEKTVVEQTLVLEKDQRNLYESIRIAMEKRLRELFAKKGVANSHIEFLDALLKLRQVCCDARLVKLEQAQAVSSNAKLTWLKDTLPEMVEEGRKILIFSQFTTMLGLIETELSALNIPYSKLTGQTRKRQEQIDAFQDGDNKVFLISLKAGGTGLNLTAADTVIHYDPWWNPAAERQATDRAHRIGQLNPVFVYKLIAEGTVEEKIQAMQQQKQSLSDSILSGEKQLNWQGNADELLALFSL